MVGNFVNSEQGLHVRSSEMQWPPVIEKELQEDVYGKGEE